MLTPEQLFEFATENIHGITFKYCSTEEYNERTKKLEPRFAKAQTIQGTQKIHAAIPFSETQIITKNYSLSYDQQKQQIQKDLSELNEMETKLIESGFVTAEYNNA